MFLRTPHPLPRLAARGELQLKNLKIKMQNTISFVARHCFTCQNSAGCSRHDHYGWCVPVARMNAKYCAIHGAMHIQTSYIICDIHYCNTYCIRPAGKWVESFYDSVMEIKFVPLSSFGGDNCKKFPANATHVVRESFSEATSWCL